MKIYVRERNKVGSGVRQPKFRIVAVTGDNNSRRLWVESKHFRKNEIELIAADLGAEIVWLEPMPESEHHKKKDE
ncbi:hypothetical protein E2N92_09465 [Methanofollis formosanus]|uniref:Uncharacterized protein n=1 Tax=Methanofollis formosanus TaxID=299308 RepID=A0A8G1A2R9_9EURY|nr:hypothetical protein [Methanofollis formosanus]QYZ79643.1 hypothetical protein E2N92_09465 [Methanofollis formosanus]